MENKTTIELIQMYEELTEKDWGIGGKYERITEEIKTREPFASIFNEDYDDSLPTLLKRIELLESDVKKLKRHKHDTAGDVLIRI